MNGQAYDFDKAARQRKLRSDMTRWAVIGGIVLAVLIVFSQCFFCLLYTSPLMPMSRTKA